MIRLKKNGSSRLFSALGALMCVSTPSVTQKQTGTRRLQSAQPSFPRRPRLPGIHLNPSPSLDSSCPKPQSRFNTHSPAASAANAGAFLQTSLSEVTRRSKFRRSSTITRRVTPDRVIASMGSKCPAITAMWWPSQLDRYYGCGE